MAVAGNLLEAAGLASQNLFPLWQASTLQTRMTLFAQDANAIFVTDNPLTNWVAVIASFAPSIEAYSTSVVVGSATTYRDSVSYIYRMFKLADALNTQALITAAQRVALLAAYNARFA